MIISRKTPKELVLQRGTDCRKDNHCCRYSTGYLIDEDHKRLAEFLKISESELKERYLTAVKLFNKVAYRPRSLKDKKPYGPCIFLDEKEGCKVHSVKPMHCRLYTCSPDGFDLTQWFYLNYLLDTDDPQAVREYAEFIRFHEPIPGGALEELIPDSQKLKKILGYEIFRRRNED
jgi:Fe-S-cluster containining protein